jgi:outer membrane murein-binding lipoprotein Lpp
MNHIPTLALRASAIAVLLLAGGSSFAQTATEAELARRLDQLAAELSSVKAQLQQLQQQRAATPQPAPPSTAPQAAAPIAAVAPAALPERPAEPATVLSSYGEINYNRPTRASQNTQADLRRFVLGLQHRIDPKNKVVAELEVEHSVSSAGDPGEVAVEQAYIEHQIDPRWSVRGGLFLMAVGLLNENHEPTAFYGVERNFVETAIIPTTWREGGVQLVGSFDNGLTLQTGISTSFDLTKWDAGAGEGRESPLGSIHQELALAKARDLAVFGALNWRGIPGLQVGGSLFSGGATHGQAGASARVTLWDLHTRWTPGRWDLSALYSRGSISNTAALNAPLVGNPTLIPKSFDGWYAQAAYKIWSHEDYALSPFVRFEQFNTARSYADLGPGLTPSGAPTERVVTLGANFQLTQGIVVKADVQNFRETKDANRINLGLGWSF